MEQNELISIIESLIFSATQPVQVSQLREWMGEDAPPASAVKAAIAQIREHFENESRGIRLVEVAEGYQFRTPRQNGPWIRRCLDVKPLRMSSAALECLSLVAYKQPVTRAEIEAVRGVDSSHLLKMLMERNLIQMDGKTDEPGRPILYSTTPEFLEFFSIKSIRDLPTLRDLEELSAFGENAKTEQVSEIADGTTAENHEPSGDVLTPGS